MVDVGKREQLTAGLAGIMFLAGVALCALSGIALAATDSGLVGVLLTLLLAVSALQTVAAFILVNRHTSALKFLLRSLGERRRMKRSPALLPPMTRRSPPPPTRRN